MKKAPYMSQNELIAFLKLGCLCGEAAAIAANTTEKTWRQKLKTCATYLEKVTAERLLCLDESQIKSVKRRVKNTHMILRTEDQKRVDGIVEKELVTVDFNDLETLAELALNSCIVCRQGDCVAECRFRLVMHRLGIPVARDEIKAGECEFKHVNTTNIEEGAGKNDKKTNRQNDQLR